MKNFAKIVYKIVSLVSKRASLLLMVATLNFVILFALPVLNYLKKDALARQGSKPFTPLKLQEIKITPEKKKKKKIKLQELKKPTSKSKSKPSTSRFKLQLGVGGSGVGVNASDFKNIVYREGEVDQNPILIRRVTPNYPEAANSVGIAGKVILEIIIDEQGNVTKIDVISEVPEGYGFKAAAINAMWEWKFRPATKQNIPVKCIRQQPISWQ